MQSYETWFSQTTGFAPRRWQRELALQSTARSRCLRLPTGQGKTLGALSAWTWNRVVSRTQGWPKRLVWCLPMRSLTEQTAQVARDFLGKACPDSSPAVHVLMGGASKTQWHLYPEREAVIVGTQDMLLSRALNRGYGSYPARWPMEYGALLQDTLWIFDEIQLMDVGLATCAQLQAFHENQKQRIEDQQIELVPVRHSWWMSATLQPEWLDTIETQEHLPLWTEEPIGLNDSELDEIPCANSKELTLHPLELEAKELDSYASAFAEKVLEWHGDGLLALVICNTVARAKAVYQHIKAKSKGCEIHLLHSRFRQAERDRWSDTVFGSTRANLDGSKIIVATQVVEAGVDISAQLLVTELCPWPSLVQRLGRCARYQGSGRAYVVDYQPKDELSALPYDLEALDTTRQSLHKLSNVSIACLERFEKTLSLNERKRLYPYAPKSIVLERDVHELFDTTPDITGSCIDVSRFIRDGEDRDLMVFWRDLTELANSGKSSLGRKEIPRPQSQELCRVPFLTAQEWLCGKSTKTNPRLRLKDKIRAYVWDFAAARWETVVRGKLIPGSIICIDSSVGGYDRNLGFATEIKTSVAPADLQDDSLDPRIHANDEEHDSDALSEASWKTVATHSQEVVEQLASISDDLGLHPKLQKLLSIAARWHDLGKAHPAFQSMICAGENDTRTDYAKAPQDKWKKPARYLVTRREDGTDDERRGFRHELASALAIFSALRAVDPSHPAFTQSCPTIDATSSTQETTTNSTEASLIDEIAGLKTRVDFDLVVYLVAAHHGKVRMVLTPTQADCEYSLGDVPNKNLPIRGVRDDDEIPATKLDPSGDELPPLRLSLDPARLGFSQITGASWVERTQQLYERYGPHLAWLECVLRACDIRASKLLTKDPLLNSEEENS